MVYVLHYFAYSGRGELLRLIAEEGQMDYKEVIVDLKEFWEIRSKYPYGQLPMITEEGSDFELAQTSMLKLWKQFHSNTNQMLLQDYLERRQTYIPLTSRWLQLLTQSWMEYPTTEQKPTQLTSPQEKKHNRLPSENTEMLI